MTASRAEREEWISGDYVAAAIANPADLRPALAELEALGIAERTIRVYSGRAGSEELAAIGGEGLLGTMRRLVEDYAGNAKEMTERLETSTARGQQVVVVPVASLDADQVRRTLLAHSAHDVMGRIGGFYMDWVEGGYSAA